MSDETTFASWMRSHGFTAEDFAKWNVTANQDYLLAPVYTPSGRFVFSIQRNFYNPNEKYGYAGTYRQSICLYGIHKALSSIINTGVAVVVEGFSDVIALHKHGVTNAVGTMTSKLTAPQAAFLNLIADTIIVFGDGDSSGEYFASETYKNTVFKGEIIGLTIQGYDPASYCAEFGDEATLVLKDVYKYKEQLHYLQVNSRREIVDGITREE